MKSPQSRLLPFKIIGRNIEFQVVLDQTKPDAVEPAAPPEQILSDAFIGEEIHHRLDLQTDGIELNCVAKSLDWPHGGPEGLVVTGLHFNVQQVCMFALEQTIACAVSTDAST